MTLLMKKWRPLLGCLVATAVAVPTLATAEVVKLSGGFVQRAEVLCSGSGRVSSISGDQIISSVEVTASGDLRYRQGGKRFTARGVCGGQSVSASAKGVTATTVTPSCQQAGRTCQLSAGTGGDQLVVRAKRVVDFDIALPLPRTAAGQCMLLGMAKGMSAQGALEFAGIWCPGRDAHGRPVWVHQTSQMQLDDNAWMNLPGAALNGAVGQIGSAAIHANNNGGGGGGSIAAANVNVGVSSSNTVANKSGGGIFLPAPGQ